jgi:phage-Barnase-EndoU-ColicinE5/D-RelE like nuclease3
LRPKKVGEIDTVVIKTLNLSLDPNTPIFIGEENLAHIERRHPDDYKKYKDKISDILKDPDYIAKHPKKDSIEYIKVYYDEEKDDHVLVAVRATARGIHFAKTLFVMSDEKVAKYKEKDALHEYKKE